MPRFHHTNAEVLDLTRKYEQAFYKKPLGLWYDIDCSWTDWLAHNEYKSGYKNHFLLEIDFQDVLVVNSMETFKNFHAEFSYIPEGFQKISGDIKQIDWKRLAKYYTGVEIAPHIEFERVFEMPYWYTSWEVSSGCVWDLSIIKSINQMSDRDIHIQKNY